MRGLKFIWDTDDSARLSPGDDNLRIWGEALEDVIVALSYKWGGDDDGIGYTDVCIENPRQVRQRIKALKPT